MTSSDPKVQKAFSEVLARKAVTSTPAFVQETSKLSNATLEAENAFFSISKSLKGALDAPNISSSGKASLASLASKWQNNRKTCGDLLWRSRAVGGAAEGEILDFTGSIIKWLKVDHESVANKLKGLPKIIVRVEQNALKYQDLATGFATLKKDVDAFLQSLNTVVREDKQQVDSADKAAAEAINANLVELALGLNSKISDLVKMTNDIAAISTQVTVTKGVGGITTLLPKLLPSPTVGVYGAVFQEISEIFSQGEVPDAKSLIADIENIQNQVDSKKADKKRFASKDRSVLDASTVGVINLVPDLGEVADRLSCFSYLWYAIAYDLKEVEAFLKEATDDGIKETAFFEKLASTSALYVALGASLTQYQTTAVLPDIRKGLGF